MKNDNNEWQVLRNKYSNNVSTIENKNRKEKRRFAFRIGNWKFPRNLQVTNLLASCLRPSPIIFTTNRPASSPSHTQQHFVQAKYVNQASLYPYLEKSPNELGTEPDNLFLCTWSIFGSMANGRRRSSNAFIQLQMVRIGLQHQCRL